MSRSIAGKIKLNSFADIVGGDDTAVTEVPLSDLHEFKNHPFRVLDDEKMEETVESIKKYGVLMPGIVRPRMDGGGYEIIAGHRRKRACELAGLATMPVLIKNYTDDEATVTMVDTNIQREDILPSEKAKAYKMKYEAIKHQGKKGNSLDVLSEESGESGKVIQRYIKLADLKNELLEMIDDKHLGFTQGVDVSFIKIDEQDWLVNVLKKSGAKLSTKQSAEIKRLSQTDKLTEAAIWEIISTPSTKKDRKITLKADKLNKFFEDNYTEEDIEGIIISLLDKWKKESEE